MNEANPRHLRRTGGSFLVAALAAFGVDGCATSADRAPISAEASDLTSFDIDDLAAEARARIAELRLKPVPRARLEERLDALLANSEFKRAIQTSGVQAIGTTQFGEGGAIVKFGRGHGTVAFADEQSRQFRVRAHGIGASIGGSATHGLVILTGLVDARSFTGTYTGTVTSATAVTESTGAMRLRHRRRGHTLYIVAVSSGLTANAGQAKLVIAYEP